MHGTKVKGTFDGRCCSFLRINYAALEAEMLKGGSDEELLACLERQLEFTTREE